MKEKKYSLIEMELMLEDSQLGNFEWLEEE